MTGSSMPFRERGRVFFSMLRREPGRRLHDSGKDRFDNLWMHHLTPLTYPMLELPLEHWGFKILTLEKDKEKKRMKWLLPIVWAFGSIVFSGLRNQGGSITWKKPSPPC